MKVQKIIVLDDDKNVSKLIEKITNTPVVSFVKLSDLLAVCHRYQPTAAFVDVFLGVSEIGTFGVPTLRKAWPFTPILMMSSTHSTAPLCDALGAGANDYLRKPLDPLELVSRLQLRTQDNAALKGIRLGSCGDVEFDPRFSRLTNILQPEKFQFIPQKEGELFLRLLKCNGEVVDKKTLKAELWGKLSVSDNALDRKVFDLRQSLQVIGSRVCIKSTYGKGYSLIDSYGTVAQESESRYEKTQKLKKEREAVMLKEDVLEYLKSLGDPSDEKDFLSDLIDCFCEDAPMLLQELKLSFGTKDARQVERLAHRLKGSGGDLGAVKLQSLFANIEEFAASKQLAKIEDLIQEAESELNEVMTQLKKHWKKLGAVERPHQ